MFKFKRVLAAPAVIAMLGSMSNAAAAPGDTIIEQEGMGK